MMMKVTILTGSAILLAGFYQLPSTPPGKPGLWETSTSSQMNMPGMNMPARTSKVRSCVSADHWSQDLAKVQNQDCTKTGEKFSGNTYTAEVSCKSGAKGTFTITWDSAESSHSTMHMDMNMNGRSMSMDSTSTGHFVSADCGAVKPGSAVPVQ
jgi:hypothetical protein